MIFRSKIWENKDVRIGFCLLMFYVLWAVSWLIYSRFIVGSVANPYYPVQNIRLELNPPLSEHNIFGTDIFGRSLWEVLSTGLVYSLGISIAVTATAFLVGLIIGYLSTFESKFIRGFFDLLTSIVFVFPTILIAIVVVAVVGSSFTGMFVALILTSWAGYARIVRGEVKRVLGLTYVEAAQALGVGRMRLLLKTILPAIFPQISIHLILGISGVIMSEAALGFLGLGGSEYSWGSLLSMAKDVLLEAPYLAIIMSTAMGGLIISLNLIGDGLRDALDPVLGSVRSNLN